jgi:hypothetical protein
MSESYSQSLARIQAYSEADRQLRSHVQSLLEFADQIEGHKWQEGQFVNAQPALRFFESRASDSDWDIPIVVNGAAQEPATPLTLCKAARAVLDWIMVLGHGGAHYPWPAQAGLKATPKPVAAIQHLRAVHEWLSSNPHILLLPSAMWEEARALHAARAGADSANVAMPPVTDNEPKRRRAKRRGRKQVCNLDDDVKLVESWQAAKRQRASRETFCRDRGISVKELIQAQDRVKYHRGIGAE